MALSRETCIRTRGLRTFYVFAVFEALCVAHSDSNQLNCERACEGALAQGQQFIHDYNAHGCVMCWRLVLHTILVYCVAQSLR